MGLPLVRDDLTQKLVKKLTNLIHTHNYPLQRDIGILAFYESLGKLGAHVELDPKTKSIGITFGFYSPFLGEGFSYQTSITYEALLEGSGNFPRGSMGSLQDSSRRVLDVPRAQIPIDKPFELLLQGQNIKKGPRFIVDIEMPCSVTYQQSYWESVFKKLHDKNIAAINQYVAEQIQRRRENALLTRSLEGESNIVGNAIERMLDRHDLEYYERAKQTYAVSNINTSEDVVPVRLLKEPWSNFEPRVRYPSPETFEKFFWGKYIDKLRQLKGYEPTYEDERGSETFLMITQEEGLKKGKDMTWGKEYIPS